MRVVISGQIRCSYAPALFDWLTVTPFVEAVMRHGVAEKLPETANARPPAYAIEIKVLPEMPPSVQDKIDETRDALNKGLHDPVFSDIGERLRRVLVNGRSSADVLRSFISLGAGSSRSLAIASVLGPELTLALDSAAAPVQRYLLMQTAARSVQQVAQLTVYPAVKRLICDEFQFFCCPAAGDLSFFRLDSYSFWSFCKIALLKRFPAGQYHWELSGFPRSSLFKLRPESIPRVAYFVAAKMKGFAPCIDSHMAPRSIVIIEKESDKAWYRMARSVEADSKIRGLVASSWLHSPDTFKVSPHLSFINKPFVESGAIITTMGEADKNSGFLTGSAYRRKLYESGEFRPTQGVVLWSREQMIRWAHSHPELEDG
jgi:hypothetical protein